MQVKSDVHLLVRATACDCLRELELAFPVRSSVFSGYPKLCSVFSGYPELFSVFSGYPELCSVFSGYTELQGGPLLCSEPGRKHTHLPTLSGEKRFQSKYFTF